MNDNITLFLFLFDEQFLSPIKEIEVNPYERIVGSSDFFPLKAETSFERVTGEGKPVRVRVCI